jgi:hypothetical protein
MKNVLKMLGAIGLLCLTFAIPATAQIANSLNFTTTFPFMVNDTKMPAGTYAVRQNDQGLLTIQDSSGKHSALTQYTPMRADTAHTSSDVTFNRYGSTEFLNMLWVGGQRFGMQLQPGKAEKKLAATSKPEVHSVTGSGK